jgi:hypothetical protein
MPAFSTIERRASNLLKRFPKVKAQLKTAYQYLNYTLYRQSGFQYFLIDELRLGTPSSIAGLAEPGPGVSEFFGYYDICPWSFDGRYYVTHQIQPNSADADIVVYDLQNRTRSSIARTPSWTWQQGAMSTWLLYNGEMCLAFNTINDGALGTKLYSPARGMVGFLPFPIQAVNLKKSATYAINYLRLGANRTEYGYTLEARNLSPESPLEADGIWTVSIDSGEVRLIISLQDLIERSPRREMQRSAHEINHVSVSPDGEHLVFIHRFRGPHGQFSRLYVTCHDGTNLRLLLDDDMVSHYTWIDSRTLVAWARTKQWGNRYYQIDIQAGVSAPVPDDTANAWGDGHPSFNATYRVVASDSYPDRARQQHLFLMDTRIFQPREIARFFQPLHLRGHLRVDLHPRWNRDGTQISIDSGHTGVRRNYIIDVPDTLLKSLNPS